MRPPRRALQNLPFNSTSLPTTTKIRILFKIACVSPGARLMYQQGVSFYLPSVIAQNSVGANPLWGRGHCVIRYMFHRHSLPILACLRRRARSTSELVDDPVHVHVEDKEIGDSFRDGASEQLRKIHVHGTRQGPQDPCSDRRRAGKPLFLMPPTHTYHA